MQPARRPIFNEGGGVHHANRLDLSRLIAFRTPPRFTHERQTLGQMADSFFATQLGAWQSVHLCWTDGTFGVGMSAIQEQTMHMSSSMTHTIGTGLQRGDQ
jgi:hypothetical protein